MLPRLASARRSAPCMTTSAARGIVSRWLGGPALGASDRSPRSRYGRSWRPARWRARSRNGTTARGSRSRRPRRCCCAALVSSIAGFAFSAIAGCALAYLGGGCRSTRCRRWCCARSRPSSYAVWKLRESIRLASLWPMVVCRRGDNTVRRMAAGPRRRPRVRRGPRRVPDDLSPATWCYAERNTSVRGNAWRDAPAGALGGIAGGLGGFPGAFVTIWCSMRGWDKLRQRAVYQPYILAMQLVTIACLRWQCADPRRHRAGSRVRAFCPGGSRRRTCGVPAAEREAISAGDKPAACSVGGRTAGSRALNATHRTFPL